LQTSSKYFSTFRLRKSELMQPPQQSRNEPEAKQFEGELLSAKEEKQFNKKKLKELNRVATSRLE